MALANGPGAAPRSQQKFIGRHDYVTLTPVDEPTQRFASRLRLARRAAGLTRSELAERVGLPLDFVRYVEKGGAVSWPTAEIIGQALGAAPASLMSEAVEHMRKNALRLDELPHLAWNAHKLVAEFAAMGLDIHPAHWTLKLRFRGGAVEYLDISAVDVSRFWASFRGDHDDQMFFVFNSVGRTRAINLTTVVYAHVLFDAAMGSAPSEEESCQIIVLFVDSAEKASFGSEPDEHRDYDEEEASLPNLASFLDDLAQCPDAGMICGFDDEDGEHVEFQLEHVCLIDVSQYLLWGYDDEDGCEERNEEDTRLLDERPGPKLVK